MIISYSRNFIFIKTKKTAGTTVEAVLATGCGVEDIISRVSGDKYPGSDLLIPGRKSLACPEDADEPDDSDDDESLPKGSAHGFNAHSTAEDARDLLDPEFWNSAIKITAERHPYEKAVSQAYYRMFKRNPRNQPFAIHLQKTVHRGDTKIDLLPREFRLLEYFLRHPGRVITRAMLLENVWQYHFSLETNVVDVHISNLRKKIDTKGMPSLIVNIRGAGFMLDTNA